MAQASAPPGARIEVVTFLAAGRRLALPLDSVEAILGPRDAHRAPAQAALEAPGNTPAGHPDHGPGGRLLVVRTPAGPRALGARQILEVTEAELDAAPPRAGDPAWVRCRGTAAGQEVLVIDPTAMPG